MRRIWKASLACMLSAWMALGGCTLSKAAEKVGRTDCALSEKTEQAEKNALAPYDFGAKVLALCGGENAPSGANGENQLISPYSVYTALAMAASGADGATQAEFTALLALSEEERREFCANLAKKLQSGNYAKVLRSANSVWYKSDAGIAIRKSFLKECARTYGADVKKCDFSAAAVQKVNDWVKKQTNGQIDRIVERFAENTNVALVNAIALADTWKGGEKETKFGAFYTSGEELFVRRIEGKLTEYYRSDKATAFAYETESGLRVYGILPDGELASYLAELDGRELYSVLHNRRKATVYAQMPTFSFDCEYRLEEALAREIPTAFHPTKANFTKMAEMQVGRNLFIGEVRHKTHISVSAEGVKAAAATHVGMMRLTALPPERENCVEIILDRPFLVAVTDGASGIPLFIGAVQRPTEEKTE